MYKQHFGLKHTPLEKETTHVSRKTIKDLQERFTWLMQTPGIGVLTGEPGVGKTSALRLLTKDLNPNQYKVIYSSDTDFSRLDIYRNLAVELGLEPRYRRGELWRDIKQQIVDMFERKHILPIWVIDEAQNLPYEFFRDLPSFLNIEFDSKQCMTVWLVGTPLLEAQLKRKLYDALQSRVNSRTVIKPIEDQVKFYEVVEQSLKDAGCHEKIISDAAMNLLHQAAKGIPRKAGRILKLTMQMAAQQNLTHLPDNVMQDAIEELKA